MMLTQRFDTTGRDEADVPSARSFASAVRATPPSTTVIAALAVALALITARSPHVPLAAAVPVAMLVGPCLVDLLDRRLPNRMVAVAALSGLAVAGVSWAAGAEVDVAAAAFGALAFGGPLMLMHLIAPAAMGFGDVKVAAVLGGAVGLIDPVYGLLALAVGSGFGAAVGLVGRRRTIAFGPALVGGAIVSLLLAASSIDVVARSPETVVESSSEVITS